MQLLLQHSLANYLRKFAGIIGVSIIAPETVNKHGNLLEFCVYVKNKINKQFLPTDQLLPRFYEGIRVRVEEVPVRYPGSPVMRGGMSIANDSIINGLTRAGTLGCIGRNMRNNQIVALTNWHVLFCGTSGIGSKIYSPVPTFTGTPPQVVEGVDLIGNVADGIITNKVDCGIVNIDTSWCRTSGVDWADEIPSLNAGTPPFDGIVSLGQAVDNDPVVIVGRRSGRVTGRIRSINASVNAPYTAVSDSRVAHTNGNFNAHFISQIEIEPTGGAISFGQLGDSGAVLINMRNELVGLMYSFPPAGQPGTGVACHINEVIDALRTRNIDFSPNFTNRPQGTGTSRGAVIHLPPEHAPAPLTWTSLQPQLNAHATSRKFMHAVEEFRRETVMLVNSCRPVTVAWQRNNGPGWMAALIRSIQEPHYSLPEKIKGTTLETLLVKMNETLQTHGSEALKQRLQNLSPEIIGAFKEARNFNEFIHALNHSSE
jgi:hypothetical protein